MQADKMPPGNFKPFGYDTQRFSATAPAGATLEMITKPEYWSHVVSKVRPGCIVEVHAENGEWFAELYVRATGLREMKVHVLREVSFDGEIDAVLAEETAYVVKWNGPTNRYAVCMKDGKSVIKANFATKEDAFVWMREHKRTMAAA